MAISTCASASSPENTIGRGAVAAAGDAGHHRTAGIADAQDHGQMYALLCPATLAVG